MNWTKPAIVGSASLIALILLAYFCGAYLGKKPFAWQNEPLLPREEIAAALQGQWRDRYCRIGHQVQPLPAKGKGNLMEFDKTTLHPLDPLGRPLAHLDRTFELDVRQNPARFDLVNPTTKEAWVGIIEVNADKTRVRIMMRRAGSPSGRPTDFQSKSSDDVYSEYTR